MKKLGRLVIFTVFLGWGLGGAQAQESLSVTTTEAPPPLPFPLVAPEQVPVTGTFYTVQHPPGDFPPLPYNPVADFEVPVYWLGTNNWFLVDDRSIDYQALENELAAASLLTTMSTLDSEGPPPFPGDGDTNGTGGGTWEYTPRMFGSNDLYLTLVSDSLTNGTATLLIHNPESITNEPIWFVWGTTNLSFATDPWALDADNWTWLAATEAGQTNLTVPLLGAGPGFYRLADPANDSDQDGITDYQSWFYFGHALGWASDNSRAADDYDGDGTSNLNELTNGTDPNDIHFTLLATNEYFNTSATPLVATVTAGVPAQVAALVDSTNFSSAIWTPYTTSNLLVSLDSDGWHDVWVALHGRAAAPVTNWQMIRLKRDTQPPALTITQPGAETSQPLVQLQGYSCEDLASLTYTASELTNQRAFITGRIYSTNTGEFTTNNFQAFDLALAPGTNVVTLRATDRAGNVTETNLTFTLLSDTSAPALALLWPTNGTRLGAANSTLRGQLDDPTAQISATVSDTNGVTNLVPGLVERDGKFWLVDLPLQPGTNVVTLTAVDAWTNTMTTNLTLIRSGVVLVINPVAEGDLWAATVTVTGTVSDSSYSVWVNGVRATVNGDGSWTAENVPLGSGGTASIGATAYPPGEEPANPNGNGGFSNGGATENPGSPNTLSCELEQDRPTRLFVNSDHQSSKHEYIRYVQYFNEPGGAPTGWTQTHVVETSAQDWVDDDGGSGIWTYVTEQTGSDSPPNTLIGTAVQSWPKSRWPTLMGGTEVQTWSDSGMLTNSLYPPTIGNEHCNAAAGAYFSSLGTGAWSTDTYGRWYQSSTVERWRRQADTETWLFTGGKSVANRKSVWELSGSAKELLLPPAWPPFDASTPSISVAAQRIQIGDFGLQDADALLYTQIPKGTTVSVTAQVAGPPQHTRSTTAQEYSLIHQVNCAAAGDTNLDRTTLGIGEVVHLSGMPETTIWSLTGGGTLNTTNGSYVEYTAPLNPTNGTIHATVKTEEVSVAFTIIPPSGVAVTVKTNLGLGVLGTNQIGASTVFWAYILPTNVSFVNVEMRENISPAVTNTWPNGLKTFVLQTNDWGLAGFCLPAVPDTIEEPLRPISRLFNGTNYQSFSYTLDYHNEYLNQDGQWVPFAEIQTITEFRSDGTCRESYQGVSGSWQGPWQ